MPITTLGMDILKLKLSHVNVIECKFFKFRLKESLSYPVSDENWPLMKEVLYRTVTTKMKSEITD